jgi:hypothetical protein
MGIGFGILDFFHRSMDRTLGDVDGRLMAELGDQKLWSVIKTQDDGSRVWAKEYFESRGVHHYSIDIHGKNGAYPLDLSKPIKDPFWHDRFEIVTNFGTAEHVADQYNCWLNIHNLGRAGCIYVHALPEYGRYRPYHCEHWYDLNFFHNLMESNGYTKVLCEPILSIGHVGCCYIKYKKSPFVTDKEELLSWIHRK